MYKFLVKKNTNVLFILIFIMLVFALFTFTMSKADSFLLLNRNHTFFTDVFFTFYTFIGDGLFVLFIVTLLFAKRRNLLALQLLLAYSISGLLAQLLKKITIMPRPKSFFVEGAYQHFINGVTHAGWNSFPSGHTTSAFAMATLFSLYTKNPLLQVLYFLLACLVGFSRIYLGQHFLMDVFAGSVLGAFVAIAIFVYVKLPKLGKRISTAISPISVDH